MTNVNDDSSIKDDIDSTVINDMDMDGEMEDASKAKQRPSMSTSKITITSSSQEGESLRTRIWNELKSNNDAMSLADICKDVTDRSSVENAIQDLESKEKVFTSEGIVCIV